VTADNKSFTILQQFVGGTSGIPNNARARDHLFISDMRAVDKDLTPRAATFRPDTRTKTAGGVMAHRTATIIFLMLFVFLSTLAQGMTAEDYYGNGVAAAKKMITMRPS
jgi:hypothetical protein